ncbi:type III secretion protein X [Gammaproteobacteria bacterium]
MAQGLRPLGFEVGIERVSWAEARDLAPLPERGPLTPSEVGLDSRIEALFRRPDRDERLLNALKPALEDRAVLLPDRYAVLFAESQTLLEAAAREQPQAAEALTAAARLLQNEQLLRDLLAHYRGLLLRV